MNGVDPRLNISNYNFDGIFWDDDSSDDYEYYKHVMSEDYKREIENQCQREKWLKFEYPEGQDARYDPVDGDIRGNYKEVDKRRKKTWHSKGALPNSFKGWMRDNKLVRTHKHRQCRYYNKKFTFDVVKAPQLVDKYHHGTRVYDTTFYW